MSRRRRIPAILTALTLAGLLVRCWPPQPPPTNSGPLASTAWSSASAPNRPSPAPPTASN